MKFLLLVTLPLIVIDQLTKWLIQTHIPYGTAVPIIPGFFNLVYVSNTGAAFSIFQGNNFFFIALALVALAAVLFWLIRDQFNPHKEQRMSVITKIAFSLFAAGIIGNLLDRILKGSVVDFLDFYIQHYAWPSFNVADSCICVAAGLLVLMSFRRQQPGSVTDSSKSGIR
jgi:signal peptidase II